jgi:hypothetical protein
VLSNDRVTYKLKHVWAATLVEYRGAVKSVVAG